MHKLIVICVLTSCTVASKTEEYCERAESCNLLRGSVEECIDYIDSELDRLSDTAREELLYSVQQCLDRPSCGGFSGCIEDL
ncbi:MAG TPA: hypothetical protein VK427_09235 [Kofleriaceae bacterium]|nr:hypothetical protein [Kofleriaceae bacterium]